MTTTAAEIREAYPQASSFADKIVSVANDLDIDPSWLANVIRSESNFSPSIQNPSTNATGLIQFMPSTAQGLGTSVNALKNMGANEQMNWVRKYLMPYKGKMNSQNDVILAVFYPYAIDKPNSFDMADHWAQRIRGGKATYPRGSAAYQERYDRFKRQNGGITLKRDYFKKFEDYWRLTPKAAGIGIITLVGLGALGYYLWSRYG